ncbi:HET-domain-containing protein [Echria macrotheca]|uniref:HET-domain-containing protein n=1 Tax=Echria macrotheca TaxID=438768 RepID=A0AAJ0F5Z5_9PEZI|nr:HET-domain-containing protein [Echria macrotheca]
MNSATLPTYKPVGSGTAEELSSPPPESEGRKSDEEDADVFSDSGPTEKSLGDQIVERLVKSTYDEEDFLPEGAIDELITKHAARKALDLPHEKAYKKREDQIIRFIFGEETDLPAGAKKLFAITLLSVQRQDHGLARAMHRMRKSAIDDSCLPLEPQGCKAFVGSEPGSYSSPWSSVEARNFSSRQWSFLAPVFALQEPRLRLDGKCILPIIDQDGERQNGAFGDVVQVTIHENHWTAPILKYNGERTKIAIKKIKESTSPNQEDAAQMQLSWEREVEAHIAMRKAEHEHIIEFIAAVERGPERFLLFRWAEEGTLQAFWTKNPSPTLCSTIVKDVVDQIVGLADALHKLHTGNYKTGGESFRHGDLKPENILCVTVKPPQPGRVNIPQLKISDMGLAKHHNVATELRPRTSMRYTTTRYEPPEINNIGDIGRSRRYDMWSLGCVILETIIWLLHGNSVLKNFNDRIVDNVGQSCHWFEIIKSKRPGQRGKAVVHHHVQGVMRALRKDQECAPGTAIGDLLDIVQRKLLVVKLGAATTRSEGGPKSSPGCRIYSEELLESLLEMVSKGEKDDSYWFTGRPRVPIAHLEPIIEPDPDSPIDLDRDLLSPEEAFAPGQSGISIRVHAAEELPELDVEHPSSIILRVPSASEAKTRRVAKVDFPVDNESATQMLDLLRQSGLKVFPSTTLPPRLCDKCQAMDLCQPDFYILDDLAELDSKRNHCEFCKMRWDVCHHLDRERVKSARFDHDHMQSMLRLNEGLVPVFSICRTPDLTNPNSHVIHAGLPCLPEAASASFFAILRHWLSSCDAGHTDCRPLPTAMPSRPPTRLIDVGSSAAPTVRLIDTVSSPSSAHGPYKYLALSHPWGSPPHFCTYQSNLQQHKRSIPAESPEFPATFRHAITVTRELGLRYLWIDSICIIQGPDGDFDQESKIMEDVFSSAYCVIAASSATCQRDGFIRKRKERQFLRLQAGESEEGLYVCRFIDNFTEHVLESPLSKRGWVLQERALARRTIFFTDWQTYFECGDGVRCETMTKVDNKLASFLGDPNFPSKLSGRLAGTDRGEKIRFYESLFQTYSRLDFTRITDRPVAIAGLEQRMLRDLEAQGKFGIFDDGQSLLPRSLLWRRGDEVQFLNQIDPPSGFLLPSWSWMAYDGPIDFVDLPLGQVDWQEGELHIPWSDQGNTSVAGAATMKKMTAVARSFCQEPVDNAKQEEFEVVLDNGELGTSGWLDWRCIVVGTRRAPRGVRPKPLEERTHYILIVAPADDGTGEFRRIGVGKMAGFVVGERLPSRIVVQ